MSCKLTVYLCGSIYGTYRSQSILRVLSDNGHDFTFISHKKTRTHHNNSIVRLLTSFLLWIFILPTKVILIARSDIFFVLAMNQSKLVLIELLIAKMLNRKVIIDYYAGAYDASVNDDKVLTDGSVRAKFYNFIERQIIMSANKVIFLTEAEKLYYCKVLKLASSGARDVVIPLVTYDCFIPDLQKNEKEASAPFTLCWWGTFINLHGIDLIIDMFEELNARGKFHLCLFGNDEAQANKYRETISIRGLSDNIDIIVGYNFHNEKLPRFLQKKCDLAIGIFGNSDKARTVLANKVIDSIALGLPTITIETPGASRYLKDQEDIIFTAQDITAVELADKIYSLSKESSLLQKIAKQSRKNYEDNFTHRNFQTRIIQLIEELK